MMGRFDQYGPVPGWYFRIREVAQGHFSVEGADRYGRKIVHGGSDAEGLLAACIKDAESLNDRTV